VILNIVGIAMFRGQVSLTCRVVLITALPVLQLISIILCIVGCVLVVLTLKND